MNNTPTIQNAMSALLFALGFDAMALAVKTETDRDRLSRYARVIVKQSPADKKLALANNFRLAGLL
jgi:hypothetical protein